MGELFAEFGLLRGGGFERAGFASDEGEHLRATLRYDDAMVDFNGRKMPLQQFAQVLGQVGIMGQR